MSRKTRLLVQAMTAVLTVMLVTGNCITTVDARVKTFVAMEKTPSINVTRSTTDETGAVVGISVAPTAEVPAPVKTEAPKAVDTPKATPVAGIATDKLVMANVAHAVNVRAEADAKSAMVGKLYSGCGGEIEDQKSGWTKIKSGKLTGWVRNDFLVFGSSAATLAEKSLKKTATATTDTLRVRQEPNEYAEVVTLLAKGDTLAVVDTHGDWVQVKFTDGTMGYVSGQYVTIANEIGKGETLEQINARDAQVKEADKKAEEPKVETPVAPAEQVLPPVTNTGAVPAAADDVMLLAALIQCEAGNEIYEGQVAVGSVVVNRLKLGRYGNSLYNVIYAPSQFSPAGSGQVAAVLAAGPKASCIQAAQDALAGVNQVGTATKFRNVRSGYQGIVIGNHVFW